VLYRVRTRPSHHTARTSKQRRRKEEEEIEKEKAIDRREKEDTQRKKRRASSEKQEKEGENLPKKNRTDLVISKQVIFRTQIDLCQSGVTVIKRFCRIAGRTS
jgi:hypothetical protein